MRRFIVNSSWIRLPLAPAIACALFVAQVQAQESVVAASESRLMPLDKTASLSQTVPECASDAIFLTLARSQPGFELSASALYLQPISGNLQYATLITPFPFQTPHWNDQTVKPDFTPAFNIGVRYDFGC